MQSFALTIFFVNGLEIFGFSLLTKFLRKIDILVELQVYGSKNIEEKYSFGPLAYSYI